MDEAEVDDEVEDDEEWEEGAEDIIDRTRATEENTSRDIDSHRRLQMMWTYVIIYHLSISTYFTYFACISYFLLYPANNFIH